MTSIRNFSFFIIVLTLPIFLPVLLSPYGYIYTFTVLITASIFYASSPKEPMPQSRSMSAHTKIFYLFIIIIISKAFKYSDFSNPIFLLLIPFVLSLAVIRYASSVPLERSEEFISKCIETVYYVFLIQLVLSVFESLAGSYLVSGFNAAAKSYQGPEDAYITRFIIPVPLFLNPFNYLRFGLSGLLGQHNQWGLQLPIYNLIFLYGYLRSRNSRYLMLMFLVIVAIILNTTRTSLVLIVISDVLLFFYLYVSTSKRSRMIIYIIAAVVLALTADKILLVFQAIVTKSDTLSIRLSIYQYAWYYLKAHFSDLVIGYDYHALGNLVTGFLRSANYNVVLHGFENGFFDMTFVYGISGFMLFLLFVFFSVRTMWENQHKAILGILFVLMIIFLNITLSHVFLSFVLPFITLFLILVSKDAVLQKELLKKQSEV